MDDFNYDDVYVVPFHASASRFQGRSSRQNYLLHMHVMVVLHARLPLLSVTIRVDLRRGLNEIVGSFSLVRRSVISKSEIGCLFFYDES